MVKLTKRKGFNFFRSYFDVYNELNDKNKVAFMDALLERQFLGVKPTKLTGMASFAYISQTNSIDSQVRGYEDKTGTTLYTPSQGGTVGAKEGGSSTPSLQVQEKGEVQEKEKGEDIIWPNFNDFWDLYDKKVGKKETVEKKWNELEQSVKEKIIGYIPCYIESQPNKKFRKNPLTFLGNDGWNDELILTDGQSDEQKRQERIKNNLQI